MSTTSQPKVTLVRGSIWTGLRHVESMAIRDGVVVALGQEADDLANSPASHTATLDLGQSVVMPGFRDGHVHPLIGGRERNSLDLSGTSSAQEALTSIRAYAEANPDETWIQGGGYDPTHFGGGIAEASILDTACAERPVLLISTDHHMAWVNTKAMQLAGIDSKTLDPALGSIPRYGDNSPMGTLLEWGAIALVTDLAPNPTREDDLASMSIGMRELSSAGIVWAQDAAIGTKDADLYVDAAKQGILSSRINLAWRLEPDRWISQEDGIVNRSTAMSRDVELVDTLSANTVKFFADGVIEGGTGFLLEPYENDEHSHTCGLPNWTPHGLAEAARHYDNLGFQIHIHAIGDGGVRMALDAIEHAVTHNPIRDRRPVIAHAQVISLQDRPRFAKLGVIANFEPLWACLDDVMEALTVHRLGPERSALQYSIGSMLNTGARLSFGSDWPVSSVNPLHGLAVAVTRTNKAGEPVNGWLPNERIPIQAALAAYTTGSAHQAFDDDAGQLEVGQRADFCALEADITSMSGADIGDVSIQGTWVAGKSTYEA